MPDPPRRQEVGRYDLDITGIRKVMSKCLFDWAMATAWTAEQNLLVWKGNSLSNSRFAQLRKELVLQISPSPHFFEADCQPGRNKTLHSQAQVTPTTLHTISLIFLRDVESSDNRDPIIAHKQFAVITNTEPVQGERIEEACLAAHSG